MISWEVVPEEIKAVGFGKDGISANVAQSTDEMGWEWSVSHSGMMMSSGSAEQAEEALQESEAAVVRLREAIEQSTPKYRMGWDLLREDAKERSRKKLEELRQAVQRHNAILQGRKPAGQG